jgi:hypothetical protein
MGAAKFAKQATLFGVQDQTLMHADGWAAVLEEELERAELERQRGGRSALLP